MQASTILQYFDAQEEAIQALIVQLDEIQVAFNAQFDAFKAQHDAQLDRLTEQISENMDAVSPALRSAIDMQLAQERKKIDDRRQKLRDEYLPQRQKAADDLLAKSQAELASLRSLNPKLNKREEGLKKEKAELETRLDALNKEIRQKSKGLGLILHFKSITKADRERHQLLGKLEAPNRRLQKVRLQWEEQRTKTTAQQAEYQSRWQLESIAVARLQSELDQLEDEVRCEELALRRAVRMVIDALKEPTPSGNPDLDAGLKEMIDLNIQTDDYHAGLAAVGGFIGLLRGIKSGIEAIRNSIDGLRREQEMHSAYLAALDFSFPASVDAFHKHWPTLAKQFSDEKAYGANPTQFAASVTPILEGPLSQTSIEATFDSLNKMIEQAAARW